MRRNSTEAHSAILIFWSDESNVAGLSYALMWQQFSIFFALLISINRGQLLIFDSNFALNITSPPFSPYLLSHALDEQFGYPSDLFARCGKWRRWLRYLTFLYLGLWFIIVAVQTLSETAFIDSFLCGRNEFGAWVKMLIWRAILFVIPFTSYIFFKDPLGLFTVVQYGIALVYLFRHYHTILKTHRDQWERRPHSTTKFKFITYVIGILGESMYVHSFALQ